MLWWLEDEPTLSHEARTVLGDVNAEVYVSAVSIWELAIKMNSGKLNAPPDLLEQVDANGWVGIEVSLEHGMAAGMLPRLHSDPFDRMLIAQAQALNLTIITRDRNIARYDVPTLRA